MIVKHPPCPELIRKPPAGFNWLDHRLVRNHYIDKCSHQAAALYLFLVTVSDAQGLSYYSETVLMSRLSMDRHTLNRARQNLTEIGLIAYKKPLYQVLALDEVPQSLPQAVDTSPLPEVKSIKDVLKLVMEDTK